MISFPNKEYITIGEVSDHCGLKAHVLRYWEKEFPQLQPIKRNKRRYYQTSDIAFVERLKKLLYEEGYSIQGAKALLESEQQPINAPASQPPHTQPPLTSCQKTLGEAIKTVDAVLDHLKTLR